MSYKSPYPCVCCGISGDGMVCYHHLLTRKARPDLKSDPRNMISVCQYHHNMFHSKGISFMANSFKTVKFFLEHNGWVFEGDKWKLYV